MGQNNYIRIDDFEDGTARSHLYRYYCSRGYVEPDDVVIDAACGSGYGTELISRIAKKVIGIDRDVEAIQYAMFNHKKNNNYFIAGNLDQMEKLPECDVAVSIETLEHLRFPNSFATKLGLATKKKIFLTTPIIPTKHDDPTHLHDFTEQQVYDMFIDDNWGLMNSSLQGPYLLAAFYRK